MAILIRRSPEPLSEQSARPGEEGQVIAARSAASRILREELLRYCDGAIQGRSFLIAGHRGAGKTTMVADVLTTVIKQSREGEVWLRPLPVMLHGPSLFRALPSDFRRAAERLDGNGAVPRAKEDGATASAPAPGSTAVAVAVKMPQATSADASENVGASAESPAMPSASTTHEAPGAGGAGAPLDEDTRIEVQAQLALKQIILGLHRAVMREFAGAYRQAVLHEPQAHAGAAFAAERGELAAQFELELMEDPPAARLREMWEQAGALETGILFPRGRAVDVQTARRQRESGAAEPLVPDQGTRELVALNGICNAHQRISGELSGEVNDKHLSAAGKDKVTGIDPRLADAFKPAASIVSGAAVAGGSIAAGFGLPSVLLLGIATAVGSSLVFRRSSTFTGKRERQIDRKFIPDLTVRTLDRVLPTLLERLRNAGLAPVFVIDELDKVDGLSDRIIAMVHYLKKLVAESVFTCFLTDRGYMEFLRLRQRERAYDVAYSYFTHPLLVAHEPADFDAYLDRVLVVPQGGSAADVADREILKWVLRHRSQMHALNLTREIAALRTDWGECNLRPGLVRQAMLYRIDATMQVAIEFFLNSPAAVGWAMQRPNMRQTLLDALYYISREWLGGARELHLDPGSASDRQRFRAALFGRMNIDEVRPCPVEETSAEATSLVSDDDLKVLFETACAMARFLADVRLATRIDATWPRNRLQREGMPPAPRPSQVVLEALLLGQKSVLVSEPADAGRYTFRYWQTGQLRDAPDTPREPREIHDAAANQLAFVAALETSVAALLQQAAPAP